MEQLILIMLFGFALLAFVVTVTLGRALRTRFVSVMSTLIFSAIAVTGSFYMVTAVLARDYPAGAETGLMKTAIWIGFITILALFLLIGINSIFHSRERARRYTQRQQPH